MPPCRSPNGYIVYSVAFCKENKHMKHKDAIKLASDSWNSMSNQQKRYWQLLANKKRLLKKVEENAQILDLTNPQFDLEFNDPFVIDDYSPMSLIGQINKIVGNATGS